MTVERDLLNDFPHGNLYVPRALWHHSDVTQTGHLACTDDIELVIPVGCPMPECFCANVTDVLVTVSMDHRDVLLQSFTRNSFHKCLTFLCLFWRDKQDVEHSTSRCHVWSDMGSTRLWIMCQAPDQAVENVMGQWPQTESMQPRLAQLVDLS